jgi:hypothetical protein
MKFNLDKNELKKVQKLIHTRYTNMGAADFYNEYLDNFYEKIDKSDIDLNDIEKSFYLKLLNLLDIDRHDKDFIELEKEYKLDKIKQLDIEKYLNNPFYKNIKISEKSENDWTIKYGEYLAYEGFVYEDTKIIKPYNKELTCLGFFDKNFKFIKVEQNGTPWMSITPHEINTMEKAIENAKGHVLVYGLGLGYFPYMCLLKDAVIDVTIIESDDNVINLFKSEILPQIKRKDNIKIIKSDAFNFATSHKKDKAYNYIFVDLWHDANDGLEKYLNMKKLENSLATTDYWIEETLKAMYLRAFVTVIEECSLGASEDLFKTTKNYFDIIVNEIYFKTKHIEIKSLKDIEKVESYLLSTLNK